ncbi:MAG: RIP metalloprotease RseP [Terracidiphilus sp.]|jgi:regulator of sigma E protease
MHELLVDVVSFIVLVGIMVVVHEFGHFAVAKLCGVRVEAFSFGFGPRLFGYKHGDTDYKVCLLPVGGFVKMTGESPEQNLEVPGTAPEVHVDDPGSFMAHPRWQRMLIGVAGPVSNFILAFLLMLFYFGWINEVPSVEVKTTTVEWVIPNSAAAQAGIQPGDTFTHFANADNPSWEKVYEGLKLNADQIIPVSVDRGGKTLQLYMHVPASAKADEFDPGDAGILPQFVLGPIGVSQVQPGNPAAEAGLRAGDSIESVDGHPFHTVSSLLAYMQAGEGNPITLTVLRNGTTLSLVAHPAKLDANRWMLGFVPVQIPYRHDPLPLPKAVSKSTTFCADNSFLIFEVLRGIFTRKVSVSQLAGPVGIARMAGDAAETKGWLYKFNLAAVISVNLGILNLLPFPILDGGGIFLLLIESTIRRDIGINVKERIYQGAFVVLLAFFAFIIFNDVSKLPFFTHLKP